MKTWCSAGEGGSFGAAELSRGSIEFLPGQCICNFKGYSMQVLRWETGAEIGSVPPDGAIVHQCVFQEDLLPTDNIRSGKDLVSRLVGHPLRDRRTDMVAAGGSGDPDQYGKLSDKDEENAAPPPG